MQINKSDSPNGRDEMNENTHCLSALKIGKSYPMTQKMFVECFLRNVEIEIGLSGKKPKGRLRWNHDYELLEIGDGSEKIIFPLPETRSISNPLDRYVDPEALTNVKFRIVNPVGERNFEPLWLDKNLEPTVSIEVIRKAIRDDLALAGQSLTSRHDSDRRQRDASRTYGK